MDTPRSQLAMAPSSVLEPAPQASTPAAEVEALSGDPNFMTSLARGLAVIRAFSGQQRTQTIAQISRQTGIPRAAVRRCLYTLAQLGYVSAQERNFSLQPKVLSLGYAYLSSMPLASVAQPFLDQVNKAVHESCSMSILDDDEVLYIARSTLTTRIMSVDLSPGSRLPAYCTSMGRVLLAHLPPAQIRAYLARLKPERFTEYTLTSKDQLAQAIDSARRQGYSIVDQELELGLRSIAVPVSDTAGKVVAAMNIGAQAARVSAEEMTERFLPHLLAATRELSQLILP